MRKLMAIAAALLAFATVAAAQPRAAGIRIGAAGYGKWGIGAEASYQHWIGNNFVEGDLGWGGDGASATASYNFIFTNAGKFNFYAGPGIQFGGYNYYNEDDQEYKTGFGFGILAQVGAEYLFEHIPIAISLDWRPTFYAEPATKFSVRSIAVGIRYRF